MPDQHSQAAMLQLSFTHSSQCLRPATFPCASVLFPRAFDIMLCQSLLPPLGLPVLGCHLFFPDSPSATRAIMPGYIATSWLASYTGPKPPCSAMSLLAGMTHLKLSATLRSYYRTRLPCQAMSLLAGWPRLTGLNHHVLLCRYMLRYVATGGHDTHLYSVPLCSAPPAAPVYHARLCRY